MKIEQLYTGCLAESAYYIESEGEAVIIDPLRETSPYIKMAEKYGAKIKYIFETHFHADFVSGHIDLASQTGATIVFGPNAETSFAAHIAKDGEEFKIGKVKFKVLHTPGHTLESSTYLLFDENGNEKAIFTGDTLFIGDVGRPDLAVKSDLTKEDLAGMLYDSLRTKIIPLPNDVIVYPAHGSGSACGKSMSKETFDTLGNQKETNYALKPQTKEQFIKNVTEGILPPPQYFSKNALMNKKGYENFDKVVNRGMTDFTPQEFEVAANQFHALVLDTRAPQDFAKGFIPNSINIGLDGQFAPWVGALILDLNQPILVVAEPGKEEEVVTRLSRVGYDNTIGYLKGGFTSWEKSGFEIDTIQQISAEEFVSVYPNGVYNLDVRRVAEYEVCHLPKSNNKPLDFINEWVGSMDKNETYYINCAGGYRSMITASILKSRGFENVVDIAGGFASISQTSLAEKKLSKV